MVRLPLLCLFLACDTLSLLQRSAADPALSQLGCSIRPLNFCIFTSFGNTTLPPPRPFSPPLSTFKLFQMLSAQTLECWTSCFLQASLFCFFFGLLTPFSSSSSSSSYSLLTFTIETLLLLLYTYSCLSLSLLSCIISPSEDIPAQRNY